ncbi:MAG: tRNA uridine-5-carboxymethylaminomethyl(34) synthesis enzyme MnmG [Anaerohalosphaeraceae bacterium]|nr:tRNA uridine-5-carboxymethylaminomethyl(34) synthesis enzyme MnmG [Anaerohalosphaeraceae bacterium]
MKANTFDCIVIGAGHAGAEAAHAAARLGAKTLLLTMSRETIAMASCNPAIGGLGKGQIAREIDALGGLMGTATDSAGIQFRLLNRSKGPAVRSPRAQIDKYKYSEFIRQSLEATDGLTIIEATAAEILTEKNAVTGIRCADGSVYNCKALIITAGTFLRGVMHIGSEQSAGGRLGEPAANALSDSLKKLGLRVERLKTGTPARLDAETIDYDKTEIQLGDDEPYQFSFMNDEITQEQIPCWTTYTNEKIHKLLRDNLRQMPLYSGQIKTTGPRYCPSIETKIMRFADKGRHQVFLEPEDAQRKTIYCNGISTSAPRDIQEQMLKFLPGTENARIVHYAYAIEYDYCPAEQLKISLETKRIAGLFLAGQVNGTSGYEEAGAQGLLAGVNAARKIFGDEPLVLGRDQAYIGVMIDDLLTRPIDEPYRMFTSRAEYRLSLRSDNADRRLTPIGKSIGLVSDQRCRRFEIKTAQLERLYNYLKSERSKGKSLWQQLSQPENPLAGQLSQLPAIKAMSLSNEVIDAAVIDAKYAGYTKKQQRMVEKFRRMESHKLPLDLDYNEVAHLRAEAKEKLSAFTPATLGQAGRIGGITPADLMVIQIHLKKKFSM